MDPRDMFNPYSNPYLNINHSYYPNFHTNKNPPTPTTVTKNNEHESDHIEEIPVLEKTPQSIKEKARWMNKDDLLLCSAWLNVSTDAVIGIDQGNKHFWGRIEKHYDEHRDQQTQAARNKQGMQNHWTRISQAVSKVVGCMDQIEARRESGLNDGDKKNNALDLYKLKVGENFSFFHAWEVLRNEQKWTRQEGRTRDTISTERPGPKRNKGNTSNHYNSNGTISNEDSETFSTPRPPGRKASKAACKQKGQSAKSLENIKDAMNRQYNTDLVRAENLKKLNENLEQICKDKQKYHETQKKNHEDNMVMQLMQIDPSTLDEDQRKLYKKQIVLIFHDE